MQNLNRFVTYIYSYLNLERDVNVGFAKVDRRGDYVRMEIQIRKKVLEKKAGIYLLAGDIMRPTAILIGRIYFDTETGIYKGRIPVADIGGSGYSFEQIIGLYIKNEEEMFASQWIEEELRLANLVFWEEETKEEEIEEKTEVIPMESSDNKEQEMEMRETEEQEMDAYNTYGQFSNDEIEKDPVVQMEEKKITMRATEEQPAYDWRYEWEKLDRGPGNELVLGLALWTRNKRKS
jgi:hypothetical protein